MGLTYPSNKICPRCGTGGYVWYMDNSEYVAKCTNCGHYFRREDFPMCVLDEALKPITNYDRIIYKSPEELAEWVAGYVLNLDGAMRDISYQAWLKWMGKEAEEGE